MVLRRPTDPPEDKFLFPVMVFDLVTPRGLPGLAPEQRNKTTRLDGEKIDEKIKVESKTLQAWLRVCICVSDHILTDTISDYSLESRAVILTEFLATVGRVGAFPEFILAVFSLIVAESTVFCRLKLLAVV